MDARGNKQRVGGLRFAAGLLVLLASTPLEVIAASHNVADIAPFGLLNMEGRFTAGYELDDRERDSSSLFSSYETRSTWEEEFFLMTQSFIYHPGFLNMDIGGGVLLVQQQFESNLGQAKSKDPLFNFVTRLNFLDLKSYPFSLYYELSHPSVTTSLSGRFLLENNSYGFDSQLSDLFKSTTLRLNFGHRDSQGSGLGSIVDEDADTASFSIETGYRSGDELKFKYIRVDRESSSGSIGLPIQQSQSMQDNSELWARNVFGKNDQIDILQILTRVQQEADSVSSTALDGRQYKANIRWQNSDDVRSFLSYRSFDTQRYTSSSTTDETELGLAHSINENLSYDAVLGHGTVQQVGFNRAQSAAKVQARYSRKTGFGIIGVAGTLRSVRSDQESSVATIQVFDELLILNGTAPVELANNFVLNGSVVVSNAARTQVFVEAMDFRLVTIGGVTSVQRLLDGNIADGQSVLVDYSYETSGTAEFDTLSKGLSLNMSFLKNMNAYVSYNTVDTNVRSGELTNPFNDMDVLEFGVGTSFPLANRWTVGGQFRHTRRDEDISPLVSNSIDVNLAANIFGSLQLTLSGSLLDVNHENSIEGVKQTIYRVGLRGRAFRGTQFGYDGSYLSDTGGTLLRGQLQHRLNFQWAYRQVRFTFRVRYSDDELGATQKNNLYVSAQVTRVF